MNDNFWFRKTMVVFLLVLLIIPNASAGITQRNEDRDGLNDRVSIQNRNELTTLGTRIVFESFEQGFGPWEPDADMPLSWFITRTQEKAHHGRWSLNFTANGFFDDGTVWVVREISLPPGSWEINLSFYFWSKRSDYNNWQVVAYIGLARPEVEEDFTLVGYAGIEGWSPYSLSDTLVISEPTTGWVALGYNINWETWRTHYFDSVTLTGLPI